MNDVHDFNEQLRFSEMARQESFWGEVYRRAFPDMLHCYLNDRDNPAQRCGIDRIVVLKSTRVLRIDEKARKDDYGDILLEYLSNDRTGAPGWIAKDLTIDYLAYGVMPKRTAYLFPLDMLRRVWVRFGEDWIERAKAKEPGFKIVPARNDGYTTYSVALPTELLRQKVSAASVIVLPADGADVQGGAA